MTSNKFERVQRLNMLKSIGFEDGALYGWTFDISLFYHEIRACQDIIRKPFPSRRDSLAIYRPSRHGGNTSNSCAHAVGLSKNCVYFCIILFGAKVVFCIDKTNYVL